MYPLYCYDPPVKLLRSKAILELDSGPKVGSRESHREFLHGVESPREFSFSSSISPNYLGGSRATLYSTEQPPPLDIPACRAFRASLREIDRQQKKKTQQTRPGGLPPSVRTNLPYCAT